MSNAPTTQPTKADGKHVADAGEDRTLHLALTDIFVDPDWNSRSVAETTAETSEDAQTDNGVFTGLMQSILRVGQDDEVIVMHVQGGKSLPIEGGAGKKTDKKYQLIAGFRRYAAIDRINSTEELIKAAKAEGRTVVPNTPNGTIRAKVRDLNAVSARSLNLRENTSRHNLSVPDLIFGIREQSFVHKLTKESIGADLNLSVPHVTKLVRIASVNRAILNHWRTGGEFEGQISNVRASQDDLDALSKVDPNRQVEEYKRLLAGKRENQDDKQRDKAWLENAKAKAAAMGATLGRLERLGFLEITEGEGKDAVRWADVVERGALIKLGKKGNNRTTYRKLADAAEKAYQETLNAAEPEEGEDEGE